MIHIQLLHLTWFSVLYFFRQRSYPKYSMVINLATDLGSRILYFKRLVLAAGFGIVWFLAFPSPQIAILAWLIPGLLCMLGLGIRPGLVLVPAAVAGLTFNLMSLQWLLSVPTGWSSSIHWVLLSLLLSLFPAIWVWFCWQIAPKVLLKASECSNQQRNRYCYFDLTLWQSMVWTITCAAGWVALEFVQSHLFTGFPWNLLGTSQYRLISYIQLASVTGVSGLSFLMVWSSLSILCVVFTCPGKKLSDRFAPLLLSGTVLLIVLVAGEWRIAAQFPFSKTFKCALVQPGGRFTDIKDTQQREDRFVTDVALTKKIKPQSVDLILWPEGGVSKMLRWDDLAATQITSLARSKLISMIVCSADAETASGRNKNVLLNRYNAAFLIDSRGRLVTTYRKEHLVPWHEYIPVAALNFLAPSANHFTPGLGPVIFELPSLNVRTCVLICFEDVFSSLVRQRTALNLDFLVDLGDDGWFGQAAAQWQHLASSALRAVENGIPLLRCSANGVTCSIDAFGHLSEFLPVGEKGILYVNIQLPTRIGRQLTFYQKYGDWFNWVCILLTGYSIMRPPKKAV